jgi:cytochrome P450
LTIWRLTGPVIRITPDEIHLSDPDHYETIHRIGTKYTKYARYYNAFSISYSSFTAASNEVHRRRRAALNPFFARKMVLTLEDVVQSQAEKMCALVTQKLAAGEPANLHQAFRAISVDVASDYSFGESYNLLDSPDLGQDFFRLTRGLGPSIWIFQQFPQLLIANSLPSWILEKLDDSLAQIVKLQEVNDSYAH